MARRSYNDVGLTVRLLVLLLVVTVSSTSSLALMKEGSGRTSQYMRKSSASIDLPYTDPLVTAPPGENAPQQVWIDYLLTHSFFIGHPKTLNPKLNRGFKYFRRIAVCLGIVEKISKTRI
jgi:hypothetical protein